MRPVSLRVRLFVLVLVAVLPAVGLALYDGLTARQREAARVTADALRLARLAAANHATLVEGARQLLVTLAQVPQVQAFQSDSCDEFMASLLDDFPIYANFGVLELDGDIVCSGLPLAQPINSADRAYFQRALATGDFAVGDYQIGRITHRATLNFGYPLLNFAGQVRAVVFAALDLATMDRLAREVQLPAGGTLTVLDGNATVLARYPDAETWLGKTVPDSPLGEAVLAGAGEGAAQGKGLDGVLRLYAYTPVLAGNPHGAYVGIGVPASVAFAEANQTLVSDLIALGVIAALALIGAWFGADKFVLRPIDRLVGVAQKLEAGDLAARTGLPHGQDELGRLANAFDQMAESLEEREAEVRRLNAALELRVSERTAELERSNRDLASFAYSVSHDLRAPLRGIDGFSQALLEDYGDRLDATGQDYVARVRSATQRMAQLIDDLLDLARVSRAEIRRDKIDLSGLARAVVQSLRANEPAAPVDVVIADSLAATGDAGLLRLLLENLLGNAWKFSGTQPRPRIEFGATLLDGRETYFVRDNGVGFDMRYADKLFGPFQRLHSLAEFPGTGIGLASAERIVERHGGRIWAESAVGQGATFYFTLGNHSQPGDDHGGERSDGS